MDAPLLTDCFSRLHGSNVSYEVKLYKNEIVCQPQETKSKKYTISLASVVGCKCLKPNTQGDHRSFLIIYAYPKSGSGLRRRHTYTFYFKENDSADYEKNFATVRKWKLSIQYLISVPDPDLFVLKDFISETISAPPIPLRKWLIL